MRQITMETGAILIEQWLKDCQSIALTANFHSSPSGERVVCDVEVPRRGKLKVEGENVEMAAAQILVEIQKAILDPYLPIVEQTKVRRDTIGISTSKGLKSYLLDLAKDMDLPTSELARKLIKDGMEDFETRMFKESPVKIFNEFEIDLGARVGDVDTEQWMVRVDRHLYIRIKMAAQKYGKSLAQVAALCLGHSLFQLNPTPRQLTQLKSRLDLIMGPKVRDVAEEIGLGKKYGQLLSGVIAGRTTAPKQLVEKLAENFLVPKRLLIETMSRNYRDAAVPAFKASDEKPSLLSKPQSWEEAVRSLNLPEDEKQRLLKY